MHWPWQGDEQLGRLASFLSPYECEHSDNCETAPAPSAINWAFRWTGNWASNPKRHQRPRWKGEETGDGHHLTRVQSSPNKSNVMILTLRSLGWVQVGGIIRVKKTGDDGPQSYARFLFKSDLCRTPAQILRHFYQSSMQLPSSTSSTTISTTIVRISSPA